MAKFGAYRDLFKFNKTLMEDDYNDGQAYTLKLTNKGDKGFENTLTAKVGEAKDGAHKLALEEKMKEAFTELGGMNYEGKWKNNGDMEGEAKYGMFAKVTGLDSVKPIWKVCANTSSGIKSNEMGF